MGSPKPGHSPHLVEDELVERIRQTLGGGIGTLGLRDDAASVEVPGGGSLVVSVDSVVEGVHVDLDLCRPSDVGWKALMGALSDLAAMGARPVGALVALCVPEGSDDGALALGVMGGVAEATAASRCPIVGGDVSGARLLMVSVTALGTVDGGDPVPRTGARPGDLVLVSGPCGRSAAGLRELRRGVREGPLVAAYRRPTARLAEGRAVRAAGGHAMIDVSDGLALDLHRLADASGVGFRLDVVPVAGGATSDEALGGGEDYELVMAVAEGDRAGLLDRFAAEGLPAPQAIGRFTAAVTERLVGDEDLERRGWQHRIG
ncbi:MAG: thiamine-phosphate kinase [Acidimicrobiales bacterium]